MSNTSYLYHVYQIRDFKHVSTQYAGDDVQFHIRYADNHIRCPEWRGLKSLCKVVSYRFTSNGEKSAETRYYISSLGPGVKRLAGAIRAHWGIENQLHYILDMSFDEDHNRIRKGDGAENMAVIRHIAMNYLSQAKYLKVGIKNRRNLAAINTDILQRILDI